jgi:hypothetical protein
VLIAVVAFSTINSRHRTSIPLMALALMCGAHGAEAAIVYNVDITNGTETLTGTITTDGQTGPLAATDFTAWSFTASNPASFGPITQASASAKVTCGSLNAVESLLQYPT